jgi:hypothetical protein
MNKKFLLTIGSVWTTLVFIATIETNIQFLQRLFNIKTMDSNSFLHNIQDFARLILPFLFGWTVYYIFMRNEKNNHKINLLTEKINLLTELMELKEKDTNQMFKLLSDRLIENNILFNLTDKEMYLNDEIASDREKRVNEIEKELGI